MSSKKGVLLFLALLLPACFFVFLKFFGKNRFDVPLLHQDEVHPPAGCALAYPVPYRLADSAMQQVRGSGEAELYLLDFSQDRAVRDEVRSEVDHPGLRPVEASRLKGDTGFFRRCVLLLSPPADLVLIDNKNRIRGYYDSSDQDEVDRLIVELKILLRQY